MVLDWKYLAMAGALILAGCAAPPPNAAPSATDAASPQTSFDSFDINGNDWGGPAPATIPGAERPLTNAP